MSSTPQFQIQFRERLAGSIAKAERALSAEYAPKLALYREPERIVGRLNGILQRCTLLRSLLLFPMGIREFNELLRNEIDFVRGAELFLDELGLYQPAALGATAAV